MLTAVTVICLWGVAALVVRQVPNDYFHDITDKYCPTFRFLAWIFWPATLIVMAIVLFVDWFVKHFLEKK